MPLVHDGPSLEEINFRAQVDRGRGGGHAGGAPSDHGAARPQAEQRWVGHRQGMNQIECADLLLEQRDPVSEERSDRVELPELSSLLRSRNCSIRGLVDIACRSIVHQVG
jgi:hypothetical protein